MSLALVLAASAGIVSVFGLVWWLSPRQRTLRALRAAPRVRVVDARAGELVRIVGRLRPRATPLIAPLSGRACASYDLQVDVRRKSGKSSHWSQLFHERASCDFAVEDESGIALVETSSFECAIVLDHHRTSGTFDDATPDLERLLARHGQSSTDLFGFNRGLRYREGLLEAGEEVAVLGRARWEDDPEAGAMAPGPTSGYRETARPKRLVIEAADGPVLASDEPGALG